MAQIDTDAHREQLHRDIYKATRLADWIYHDMRLDCDGIAIDRTAERLELIENQHGAAILFGLAGSWAYKATRRVEKALIRSGLTAGALTPYVSDKLDTTQLTTAQRGSLSAIQFTKAVSTDDLEMAEAIFNAAASSSDEDLSAFILAVLAIAISLSDQAVDIGAGS